MKRRSLLSHFLVVVLFFAVAASTIWAYGSAALDSSKAYQKFTKRPLNELSKLVFLIDRFEELNVTVVFGNHEYTAEESSRYAKRYLAQHFQNSQSAASWLKLNCYRVPETKDIIYFKGSDKKLTIARDVLLNELAQLNQAAKA